MGCGASRHTPPATTPPLLHTRELLIHEHANESPYAHAYERLRALGAGASGEVLLVRSKKSGALFAMKVLRRLEPRALAAIRNEVAILRALDHPYIVALVEVFEGADGSVYLVTEALAGGELLAALNAQPGGAFAEAAAAALVGKMVAAVAYLHAVGVVHRDLKLENFLFTDGARKHVKLVDFGLSHFVHSAGGLHSVVGTPYYVAPEVLAEAAARGGGGGYGEKVDAWSLGVITYMLLTGSAPFRTPAAAGRGAFVPAGARWAALSPDAKDFVSRLLDARPDVRASARDALRHRWLAPARDSLAATPLPQKLIARLRDFSGLAGWERAVLEAAAFAAIGGGAAGAASADLAELRGAFARLVARGGGAGLVRASDFAAVAAADAGLDEAEAAALFSRAFARRVSDADAGGEPTAAWTDFVAALLPRRLLSRAALATAFDALDTHSEGFLTRDGLRAVIGADFDAAHLDDLFGPEGGDAAELRFDAFYDVVVRRFAAAAAGAESPARPLLRAHAFDCAGEVPEIAARDPSAGAAVERLPSAYERT